MQAFVSALPLTPHRPSSHGRDIVRHQWRTTPNTRPHRAARRAVTPTNSVAPQPQETQTLKPGNVQKITIDGRDLSYGYSLGSTPTVVFLPGFYFSRWQQAKANGLKIFAKRRGQSLLIEEYIGTGAGGDFEKVGTLSQWIQDTIALIDRVPNKVVLCGAGVGGWIMLHVAMQRPDKVVGLVGVNPSVDFTHDLIKPSLTGVQKAQMEKEGSIVINWGFRQYPISTALLKDAEKWLVLRKGSESLDISCPVRLLQGLNDEEIPSERILKLVDAIKSDDCIVSFVKFGDHFMEDEADMRRMWNAICEITEDYYEFDLTSPGSG